MKLITTTITALAITSLTAFGADEAKKEKGKATPEQMFTRKDANSDGKLSKEEFTKGAKDAAKAETQFGKLDKDSSGDISKEEFMAMANKKKDK